MSCYAPLFVNVSQLTGQGRSMQWSSDLIGYDALTSYGSPSYYAQKMFSTMHGGRNSRDGFAEHPDPHLATAGTPRWRRSRRRSNCRRFSLTQLAKQKAA